MGESCKAFKSNIIFYLHITHVVMEKLKKPIIISLTFYARLLRSIKGINIHNQYMHYGHIKLESYL